MQLNCDEDAEEEQKNAGIPPVKHIMGMCWYQTNN